jgi:hypothetical protein
MALIEYQTSKFSVTSLHSIDCAANRNLESVRRMLFSDWVISVKTGQMIFGCAIRSLGSLRAFDYSSPVRVLFESLTVEDAKPYGLGNDVGNPRFSSRR